MPRMPSLGMGRGEPVHKSLKLSVLRRPDNEVPMVRHRTICHQSDWYVLQCLTKYDFERLVITCGLEQCSTSDRTIHHVIRKVSPETTRTSRHRSVSVLPQFQCR